MLIILEGPDGAGKSTLAAGLEDLIQRLNPWASVTVTHSGVPTRHPLDEYLRPLTSYRPGVGVHRILDRWHWGESVYPRIRGRATQLDSAAWWSVDQYLRRLGAVVVLCSQYHDQYERVFAERGEAYLGQLAELPDVDRGFRAAQSSSRLPQTAFNWMSPVNGDMHRIIDLALKHEREMQHLSGVTTYVGPAKPTYLLFGDTRSVTRRDGSFHIADSRDPAFVPFPATSGHFLLNLGYVSTRAGIANACDVDDPRALWLTFGGPPAVALGRNAQRRLRQAGVPHGAVPHPQYVRRFHHSRQSEYGMLILQAVQEQGDYSKWPTSSVVKMDSASTPTSSAASGSRARGVRAETARRTTSTTS